MGSTSLMSERFRNLPRDVWVVVHEQGQYSDREVTIVGVEWSRLDGERMALLHAMTLYGDQHKSSPDYYPKFPAWDDEEWVIGPRDKWDDETAQDTASRRHGGTSWYGGVYRVERHTIGG